MDRCGYMYSDVHRRLRELEHQREAGAIDWREFRAAKASLLATLTANDNGAPNGEEEIISLQRHLLGGRVEQDAEFDRSRRRAA